MTNNANVVLEAIHKLIAGKNLPISVNPQKIKDETGLSDQELKVALSEIADNDSNVVLLAGSDTFTNVSLSLGFK
ncbi:hypothetical protein [Leuconostoc lactis]|uniref:hypothetical protein n=1 Tax=Leuconostoc lactis TaxID=1246 RepID=UPI00351E831F